MNCYMGQRQTTDIVIYVVFVWIPLTTESCACQLKSLFPKRVISTFGPSEKNRFLWQNLYTCLWENKIYKKKKKYLRELSRSKFQSVTSSTVNLYNDVKN